MRVAMVICSSPWQLIIALCKCPLSLNRQIIGSKPKDVTLQRIYKTNSQKLNFYPTNLSIPNNTIKRLEKQRYRKLIAKMKL